MDFTYNTYKQYLKAYTYLIRVSEPFSYLRESWVIRVDNPDDEVIKRLNGFK